LGVTNSACPSRTTHPEHKKWCTDWTSTL